MLVTAWAAVTASLRALAPAGLGGREGGGEGRDMGGPSGMSMAELLAEGARLRAERERKAALEAGGQRDKVC